MNSFTLYAVKNGVQWYRCNCCMNLTRGKPDICPVCNGHGSKAAAIEQSNTDVVYEHAVKQLKDIIAKYGGEK